VALPPLPVDAHVAEVRDALARHRAAILTAAPGTGKTTRIPPALVPDGPVILLQPRRVAARSVARRIADERQWTLGREVGWQIRFDRQFTSDTRLLVVTEGILTARLQQDPLLSAFSTIVLDEFHERSIHGDVGLALARQAWRARDDLRILVMSATLDAAAVSAFLDRAPVVAVDGAPHPLTVEYGGDHSVADAALQLLARTGGHVLCFLPGAREIEDSRRDLAARVPAGVEVVPLHGSLDAEEQDKAVRGVEHRRIILATNIAETSLTVPGVGAVVDSGEVKVARYDADRGIDVLAVERVTADSADQRAGRAARLGPGIARRLWDAHDRLRPHREPDIARIDLTGPLIDILAWGGEPYTFEWFETPSADRIDAALRLLVRLGAVDSSNRLTTFGRKLQRIPAHPRIAAILLDARAAPEAATLCAMLSTTTTKTRRHDDSTTKTRRHDDSTTKARRHDDSTERVAAELRRAAVRVMDETPASSISDARLRHAVFTGYADRLAQRRAGSRDRFLLATGHGAFLTPEVIEASAEYIVALDAVAAERQGAAESRIRAASPVERDWIRPTSTAVEHRFDGGSRRVRAARIERYDALVLSETPVSVDPAAAGDLLADAWLAREADEATERLLRRLSFAQLDVGLPSVVRSVAAISKTLDDITTQRIEEFLPFEMRRTLDEWAPDGIVVPSGRRARLEYLDGGGVAASVKLQELFGLAESPLIGPSRVPVTFHLLSPAGRPVQTTRDLRSFWERTYPEVRKELRARYPKHPWPDDPWTAKATHRTVRRPRT
jgi:ATP-dependent helicase HrpB